MSSTDRAIRNIINMLTSTPTTQPASRRSIAPLPTELLYTIAEFVLQAEDLNTLHTLRLVSRQFNSVIQKTAPFITQRRDPLPHCQQCLSRKPPHLMLVSTVTRVELCKFLARPGGWNNNQRFPLNLDLHFCSGCKLRHPFRAFSHSQLKPNIPDHKRICIAREGRLKLCTHASITWSDVESKIPLILRKLSHPKSRIPMEEELLVTCSKCAYLTTPAEHDPPPISPCRYLLPTRSIQPQRQPLPAIWLRGCRGTGELSLKISWTTDHCLGAIKADENIRYILKDIRASFMGRRWRDRWPGLQYNCFCCDGEEDDDNDDDYTGSTSRCRFLEPTHGSSGTQYSGGAHSGGSSIYKNQYVKTVRLGKLEGFRRRVSFVGGDGNGNGNLNPRIAPYWVFEQKDLEGEERDLRIGERPALFNPSHEWFHAVDMDSYVHQPLLPKQLMEEGTAELRTQSVIGTGKTGAEANNNDDDDKNNEVEMKSVGPLKDCKDPRCEFYYRGHQIYCPYTRKFPGVVNISGRLARQHLPAPLWDTLNYALEEEAKTEV